MFHSKSIRHNHILPIVILTSCCVVVMSSTSQAAFVKVYLLTGQSNSLGTTIDPDETDYTPGTDAADADTRFFWSNVWNATTPIGDSGGQITTLQQQQGMNEHPTFWGPEMGFGREMHALGERDVMIIKVSRAGGGNTYWSKEAGGHMYQHIRDTVNAATARLISAGDTFEIAGLLYLQGESDSTYEASVSGDRLSSLISNLRVDLPNASNMHAVIGGIAAAGTNRDVVRTRQAALAAASPTIDYFSTLDLTEGLYDNLHYDKPSKLEVGRRYAKAFVPESGIFILLLGGATTLLIFRRRGTFAEPGFKPKTPPTALRAIHIIKRLPGDNLMADAERGLPRVCSKKTGV